MLYMIQVWGENQETYVKIGFSDDIDKRLATYKNCNPLVRILGTTEGGLMEEKKIHLYLKDLGYKANFLDEWFKVSPEVLSVFGEIGENLDFLSLGTSARYLGFFQGRYFGSKNI